MDPPNLVWLAPLPTETRFWTHPSLETSTSKVNSLPSRVNIWYLLELAMRYRREPMLVASLRALLARDGPPFRAGSLIAYHTSPW